MRILAAILVVPLVLAVATAITAYRMLASLPPWLLLAVIGYLLVRRSRNHSRPRPPHRPVPAPTQARTATPIYPVTPPAPQVVVVMVSDSTPRRSLPSSAPEPWHLS